MLFTCQCVHQISFSVFVNAENYLRQYNSDLPQYHLLVCDDGSFLSENEF